MTPEQVLEWARQCGLTVNSEWAGPVTQGAHEHFAALAYAAGAQAERERIDNLVKDCEITYTPRVSSGFTPISVKFDLRPLIRALPPSEGV